MIEPTSVLAVALGAVGAALFLLSRRHAEREARLERDLESVETRSRQIENDARRLREDVAALQAKLGEHEDALVRVEAERDAYDRARRELETRVTTVEAEKLTLESVRGRLEESRAELERRLKTLTADRADLERRTVGFQGEWDRQMETLEEEIQTVARQLGEFRRGTRLPIPPRE